jgi:hypothetical protein
VDPHRRRSLIVRLTLVGVAGAILFGPMLPEGKEVRRNQYRNQADCERDYSRAQCEAPRPSGGSGGGGGGSGGGVGGSGGGGYWRGPEYVANRTLPEARTDAGPGRGGIRVGTEGSMRGGFGMVGRFLRAVG